MEWGQGGDGRRHHVIGVVMVRVIIADEVAFLYLASS